MSKPRNIALDYHLIGDDDAVMDWVAEGDSSVWSSLSADVFDLLVDAEEPTDADLGIAEDGEPFHDAVPALMTDAAGVHSAAPVEDFDTSLWAHDWSIEATPLFSWDTHAQAEGYFDVDFAVHMAGKDGQDAAEWRADFASDAGWANRDSSALMFLDAGSNARPENPGGGNGGGSGGGKGGGNGGGNGGGGNSDPGVLPEYLSGPEGGYNILIEFEGSWTTTLQDAFVDSADLISGFILGDLADVFYHGTVIDDLNITASLTQIDGTGGILGQAGPTAIRTSNYLPAVGEMEFDSADADVFFDLGLWDEIVLHEMLHTVGFGTVWDFLGLVDGSGTSTPTFTGSEAVLAYESLFGGDGTNGVPLEESGGAGTAESHWDEETFGGELMTGYLNLAGNYLSDMTVASLEDLGYDTTWTSAAIA